MTTKLKSKQVYLAASGDLRLSANQQCWPEQSKMETALGQALKAEGWTVVRAHPYDRQKKHGFIDSQKMGMEVFAILTPMRRSSWRKASGNTVIMFWPD